MTTTTPVPRPAKQPRKPAKDPVEIDVDALVIDDTPPSRARMSLASKYDEKFSSMKLGQAIVCKANEVLSVRSSMCKWLKDNNKEATVQSTRRCDEDGKARVWMLPPKNKGKS